ncbi:short-chain dehydrogenase/reductase-like protein SDR [Plenodomus tracheiphilus IPT5]|uniref:Short-chain dehydrogenase/reductase-like protein SDR n=1 Tax=Plenodomus tracheiphilus IPT5 TaxID=1408161 RepID=A0A6A7B3T7_9PLEO|nr:short-chain dehydrogenase/reductase-like protein SDR [Plenodomus tracheiphilus IPT5]
MSAASFQQPLNILLTGGGRGIGRGLFRHFLSAGHRVMILDSDEDELSHVRTHASQWSSGIDSTWRTLKCDLSQRDQIRSAVEVVKEQFDGKLDVLINNAFPTTLTLSEDRRMEAGGEEMEAEWDLKLAVGLTAPFILSRLCIPLLTAGHSTPDSPGTIINISSTRAYQAESDHEAYSAVKAGLLGLTQSMSISLGHRHGIRVNAIIPGWIHVANESKAADERGAKWEDDLTQGDHDWHPSGRVGKVDDMAKAIEYAVGSTFVTGQEIVVDGGVGRKMVYPE